MFNKAPHGKELSKDLRFGIVALHKDGLGYKSAAGTGELRFIEGNMDSIMYCTFLKQNMMPSLQKLGRTAVFRHDNDPKHTTKMTIALLRKVQ
ncbi:hypothetical protein M9458_050243, partial [Cirrhinus mrigala]